MAIDRNLAVLALHSVIDCVSETPGLQAAAAVVQLLERQFTDHTQRLNRALERANQRAWRSLEVALAGDSLWERCKSLLSPAEERAFRPLVQSFLQVAPLAELEGRNKARQLCLSELQQARKSGLLGGSGWPAADLTRQVGGLAQLAEPQARLDAEWKMVHGLAVELKRAGHGNLAWLVAQRPAQGQPLLVLAVRYFFRREVEEDERLSRGLTFQKLEGLGQAQEAGFRGLEQALQQHERQLNEALDTLLAVAVETRSAVLDIRSELQGQGEELRQVGQAVQQLLVQMQQQDRPVRSRDSLSIRSDRERQLVKDLLGRYRALPEEQRRQAPAVLNGLGKLEIAVGDYKGAEKAFATAAGLAPDRKARAEAHHNAYRAALEQRRYDEALKQLQKALSLDPQRFAPFPLDKYEPQRILGAGGFGVTFLCKYRPTGGDTAVKALTLDGLDRDINTVFQEAGALDQLHHPAIVHLRECGFADREKAQPFLVMEYFEGQTLEAFIVENGPLSPDELIAVAQPVAEALEAAHEKGILHRDVKPANLLVRRHGSGWQVKLIDFGLALKQSVLETAGSSVRDGRTLAGSSIAGTLDYAAPEQMGRLPGVRVGPPADVYGFGKTCCYALFKTTQPLRRHWNSLPEPLAELLEQCLQETPEERPACFAEVLEHLNAINAPAVLPVATTTPAEDLAQQRRDEQFVRSFGITPRPAHAVHEPMLQAVAVRPAPIQPEVPSVSRIRKAIVGATVMAVLGFMAFLMDSGGRDFPVAFGVAILGALIGAPLTALIRWNMTSWLLVLIFTGIGAVALYESGANRVLAGAWVGSLLMGMPLALLVTLGRKVFGLIRG